MQKRTRYRRDERGQTLLLVVVAMSVLVGMAALAIDIATLYTASNETRRAAEAAALSGAQAFVSSSFTSGWLPQSTVCSGNVGSPGLAEQRALQVVASNPVAGGAATLQASVCNFGNPANPQFSVTVQRTGLPTFFGRIWGSFPGSVTTTAKAEAYNLSGTSGPPIQVGSVKPWAVPNCDPTHPSSLSTSCAAAVSPFIDGSGGIANAGSIVGKVIDLTEIRDDASVATWATAGSPGNVNFLAVGIPISAASVSCPSAGTFSCNPNPPITLQPATPGFKEAIACANSTPLSCGQALTVNALSGGSTPRITDEPAALCLIHADRPGINRGQDKFCNNNANPSCPSGSPISVDGGDNNPDPGLVAKNSISRSDSVVTVPVFNSCGAHCSNGTVTVVGFLQLGIARVRNAGPLRAIIMNVVGCGSPSGTAVSGGGASPIPVRLVQ